MTTTLNKAQIEILKLFAADLSEEELEELRQVLIEFRYRRLQQAIDQRNPSQGQIKAWSKGQR